MQTVQIYTRQCKNFRKDVKKINGRVYEVIRRFPVGEGFEYEKKFCAECGLKYTGIKVKLEYGETIDIECHVCKNNKKQTA